MVSLLRKLAILMLLASPCLGQVLAPPNGGKGVANPANAFDGYVSDSGSANAYAVTFSPAGPASYAAGLSVTFKAVHANTGASTLNVNSLGTKSIKKGDGATALASGDIAAGQIVHVVYDGTNFQMAGNASGGGGGTGCVPSGTNGQLLYDDGSGDCSDDTATTDGSGNLSATSLTVTGPIKTGATPPTACGTGTSGCAAAIGNSTRGTPTSGQCYIQPNSGNTAYMASCNGDTEQKVQIQGAIPHSCEWGVFGNGTSGVLSSGDDNGYINTCFNDSGSTRTITSVICHTDDASNTTTANPTFGTAGTGTTILSGALTCGSSNTFSSSGTISNASWSTGKGIAVGMGGTLTGHYLVLHIDYTAVQ